MKWKCLRFYLHWLFYVLCRTQVRQLGWSLTCWRQSFPPWLRITWKCPPWGAHSEPRKLCTLCTTAQNSPSTLMSWWFVSTLNYLKPDKIFICTCIWNTSKDLLIIWLMKCLVFCVDCNPGLSGGSVWECEDELQWRPGPTDQTADQLSLPEEGCHVCAGLPTWQKTASSRQSWERKDYHSTAICATQASWLQ